MFFSVLILSTNEIVLVATTKNRIYCVLGCTCRKDRQNGEQAPDKKVHFPYRDLPTAPIATVCTSPVLLHYGNIHLHFHFHFHSHSLTQQSSP